MSKNLLLPSCVQPLLIEVHQAMVVNVDYELNLQ
jgi:hypothetical protein